MVGEADVTDHPVQAAGDGEPELGHLHRGHRVGGQRQLSNGHRLRIERLEDKDFPTALVLGGRGSSRCDDLATREVGEAETQVRKVPGVRLQSLARPKGSPELVPEQHRRLYFCRRGRTKKKILSHFN